MEGGQARWHINRLPTSQGDNPFTPEVEPSPPAAVVTLLTNEGGGPARALEMQSLQPTIVENEKGLLVAFNITAVAVNGRPQPRALQAAVGDLSPNSSALVVWSLRCSLQVRSGRRWRWRRGRVV